MKKLSWEIILAGLFFVAIAIYLLGKPSEDYNENSRTAEAPTEPKPPAAPSQVRVIDVESLKELSALKELKNLDNIKDGDQAENLKKLKELAHLIPSEARDEFLTEIDNVIRELSNEDIQINFDSNDKLLIINREYENLEQGNWGETSPGIYTYLNEFDASEITSTSISLPGGSLTVVGTRDKQAKFTVQASGQISSEEDLKSKIIATTTFVNGEAVLSLDSIGESVGMNLQLQATLYIPETMELTTHTDAGHIEITNIKGDQVYETGGGHIKLHRVVGDIVAVSGGGHISVDEASGDVTLKSFGGHLMVKNCDGDVTLDTKGGNIEVKDVSGEIISSTQGGNILIVLKNFTHDITAETSAGNVQISIPKNSGANIDLKASNMVEIGRFPFDGSKTKNKVVGKVNGGGAEIIAFTKFGKVTISEND